MDKKILTALVAGLFLLSGCTRDSVEEKAKPTFMFWCFRKEIVSDEYQVPEMKTPAAAAYIQNRVKRLPGYVDSSYDLASGTLTVRYRSTVIRKMNVEAAIAQAGFDVNNRPARPNANLPEGVK